MNNVFRAAVVQPQLLFATTAAVTRRSAIAPDGTPGWAADDTPSGISIFYDVDQAQRVAAQRGHGRGPYCGAISLNGLATPVEQWEGSTLVVDVANFRTKTDLLGSRKTCA